jgi:hypothetical protein
MSRPEGAAAGAADTREPGTPSRARYLGLLIVLAVLVVVVVAVLKGPGELHGIAVGDSFAPFAVPLASGTLSGDANVATKAGQGEAGGVPACTVRGSQVLNICELWERGPVVLAVFVDSGSCPDVLSQMQALKGSFPGVQFAAVSLKGDRGSLRSLIRKHSLTFPVGIDPDGVLASIYKVLSCPQVSFAYPGGKVQSPSLLGTPASGTLRARVAQLVVAAKARGWKEPAA